MPRVVLELNRGDFHYIKRTVLAAPKSIRQRSVLKVLLAAQDKFFKDKARAARQSMQEKREGGLTILEAHLMLRNAVTYIMRNTKSFWEDKAAKEATVIMAASGQILWKEHLKYKQDERTKNTGDSN